MRGSEGIGSYNPRSVRGTMSDATLRAGSPSYLTSLRKLPLFAAIQARTEARHFA
jgi:hypothetical protein